jgi:hypothetical protein
MTQTKTRLPVRRVDLDQEGIYRLAAAVMMAPGSAKRRRLSLPVHYKQLAWLKGPCGKFWMNAMALISEDVTSRYASAYGVASGPAAYCTNGHIGEDLPVLH